MKVETQNGNFLENRLNKFLSIKPCACRGFKRGVSTGDLNLDMPNNNGFRTCNISVISCSLESKLLFSE
jgi:hypothetical protein